MKFNKTLSVFSCIFLVGVFLPPIYLFFRGVFPMVYASESIGYRYFHCLRILEGDFSVRLPQGHLVGLWQKLVVYTQLKYPNYISDQLTAALFSFSYLTIAFNCLLLGAGTVLFFIHNRGYPFKIYIFYSTLLLAIYGSRSGISAWITPDYYGTEIGLIALSFGLLSMEEKSHSRLTTLLGGVLFGAALATKMNLILIPISILVGLSIGSSKPKTMICRRIIMNGIIGLIFWVLVLTIFYWPRPFEGLRWFTWFYEFAKNPGGEQGFWDNLKVFAPKISQGADYSYFIVTLVFFSICILSVIKIKALKVTVLYSMLTAFFSIILLIQRPAGTTLWEVSILLLVLSGISLMKKEKKAYKMIILYLPWIFQLTFKLHDDCKNLIFNRELNFSSAKIINIHKQVASRNSGVLCLFPSNNNTCGSVEEGILKGFSDFPSWEITKGKKILTKYYPMLSFSQAFEQSTNKFNYLLFICENIQEQQKLFEQLKVFSIEKSWHLKTFPWWTRSIFLFEKNEKK